MSDAEYASELYSLVYTINILEKNFVKGSFDEFQKTEYCKLCDDLLLQYKSLMNTMDITDNNSLRKALNFIDEQEFDSFKLALRRVSVGTNGYKEKEKIDLEQDEEERRIQKLKARDHELEVNSTNKKMIAEATAAFITLLDAIKLNYNTKDKLHPLFSDVLTRAAKLAKDFKGRSELVTWLIKLNKMEIVDTLTEEELKQALWDVDSAYSGFFDQL